MAFAAAVVRGERQLRECPQLTPEGFASLQAQFGAEVDAPRSEPRPAEDYGREVMTALMAHMAEVDLVGSCFSTTAARLSSDASPTWIHSCSWICCKSSVAGPERIPGTATSPPTRW